jgi:hypothetical protein
MAFSPARGLYARALSHTSPPQGVVGEAFDLLGRPVPGEPLEDLDNARMQCASPFLEQRLVSYLLGECMLEGVLDVREQARLIEELGPLQMGEAQAECLLRRLGDGLEEREGHLRADDGGGL